MLSNGESWKAQKKHHRHSHWWVTIVANEKRRKWLLTSPLVRPWYPRPWWLRQGRSAWNRKCYLDRWESHADFWYPECFARWFEPVIVWSDARSPHWPPRRWHWRRGSRPRRRLRRWRSLWSTPEIKYQCLKYILWLLWTAMLCF